MKEPKIKDGEFTGFTERERRYIEAIFADPTDELKAVRKAGYATMMASVMAKRFRERSNVQSKLSEMRAISSSEGDVRRDDILHKYRIISTIPITQIVTWDNRGNYSVKGSHELTREQALTIKKITLTHIKHGEDKIPIVHIEQYDKLDALSALREMQGFDAPKRQEIQTQNENYEHKKHGSKEDLVNYIMAGIKSEGFNEDIINIERSSDELPTGETSGDKKGS